MVDSGLGWEGMDMDKLLNLRLRLLPKFQEVRSLNRLTFFFVGKKMTNLGDRPPIKAGLAIVGNEMEIHHALHDKENERLKAEGYKPLDQYPTYEQLMKHVTMPSHMQAHKK
jgi:hypothetical protein